MRDISTALSVVGAAACWYFVIAYHRITHGQWRRSLAGQHLMLFTANFGVLLVLIVLARLWPGYPGRPIVTMVFFGALVAQMVWRCVLLHRAQHHP